MSSNSEDRRVQKNFKTKLTNKKKKKNLLKQNKVVLTIMSNPLIEKKLEEKGISYIETQVGDKYVLDELFQILDNFELSQIEDDIYKRDLFNLSEHNSLETLVRYVEFFDNSKTSIFDFSNNKRI